MAYGDQINVGNLKTDYSGIERAGQYRGQGIASIGQGLAAGIDRVNDFFKEQSEKKKVVKQAETYINAAMTLFPEMSAHLTEVSNVIKNEDLPLSDRYAQAEGIQNLLSMGFESMKINAEKEQAKRQYELDRADLINKANEIASKPPVIESFPVGENEVAMAWDAEQGMLGPLGNVANPELFGELPPGETDLGEGVLPPKGSIPNANMFGIKTPSSGTDTANYGEPYTEEYGNIVQKNLTTGKVSRVASPPSGGIEIDTKTGKVTVGGGTGRGQQVAENADALKKQTAELGIIKISNVVNELDKMLQGGDAVSTLARVVGSKIPSGSPSRNFTNLVQSLKDAIALGSLTELRSASPTGGALGQVSNAEGQRLENKFGFLSAEQTPEANRRTLRDIAITYAETIHGTDAQLDKALKEGKLTPEQVAQGKVMRASMIERAMSGKAKGLEDARAAGAPQEQPSRANNAADAAADWWLNRTGNQ